MEINNWIELEDFKSPWEKLDRNDNIKYLDLIFETRYRIYTEREMQMIIRYKISAEQYGCIPGANSGEKAKWVKRKQAFYI